MVPRRRVDEELDHACAEIERQLAVLARIAVKRSRLEVHRQLGLIQAQMRGLRAALVTAVPAPF
jgi:hypothetical protein